MEAVQRAGCPTGNDNGFHRSRDCRLEDIRKPGQREPPWQETVQFRRHGSIVALRAEFLREYQRLFGPLDHLQRLLLTGDFRTPSKIWPKSCDGESWPIKISVFVKPT